MNKNKQLEQVVRNLCDGVDSAALLSINEDGSMNIVEEKQSDYDVEVYDEHCNFNELVLKLKALGYSIDLDTYRGLIPAGDVIKINVSKKTVTRPMVVSPNHYFHLRDKGTILATDLLDNFDEIVIKKNKELASSLYQYNKNKNEDKADK